MKLCLGSRGSKLALAQTEWVCTALRAAQPSLEPTVKIIKTKGDMILDMPLHAFDDKGLFVRELEKALLEGEIDVAVHSLKDLPALPPAGLEIAVTPAREDPCDVLVPFGPWQSLAELPQGSKIATGSLRREAQIKRLRPDLVVMPIRGNIETRLAKSEARGDQGLILAAAGLNRLGLTVPRIALSRREMIPAPAQGILGLETRVGDERVQRILAALRDESSWRQAAAERAFLREIEGGCHAPLGAYCALQGDAFNICGFFEDDGVFVKEQLDGCRGEEEAKGRALAQLLKRRIADAR